MERTAWTDERLDDLAQTLDTHVGQVRDEIHGLREDMREEFRHLRSDLAASQRQVALIGWTMVAALVGGVIALVVAVLI
jgi:gas vesicle protein